MKTKMRKEIEAAMTLEKSSSWAILSHLYKRHEAPIVYALCLLSWTISFWLYFN